MFDYRPLEFETSLGAMFRSVPWWKMWDRLKRVLRRGGYPVVAGGSAAAIKQ